MFLDVVLFVTMGWLLLMLGLALGIRSYRETRNLKPDFPRDDQLRWILRSAFAAYVALMFGYGALTGTHFHLTNSAARMVASN